MKKSAVVAGQERPRNHLPPGARNEPSNPKVKLRELPWNSLLRVHRRKCRLVSRPRRERRPIQKRWVFETELIAGEKWKRRLRQAAR